MRRHARFEESLKNLRGGAAAAAEIGSRVFSFRTPPPPPASMPTVGTRRSTRVFVPKQQQRSSPLHRDPARVLRSGKQFALSKNDGGDWLKVLDGDGSDLSSWWRGEGKNAWKKLERESVEMEAEGGNEKLFGTVYSRKRRRSSSRNGAKDRMFGVVFERKHRKKPQKVTPLVERTLNEGPIAESSSTVAGLRVEELSVAECSKNFATKLGISEGELWSRSECSPPVLSVLVDSSLRCSWERFEQFLISVMSWMSRARVELKYLFALTSCRSIGGVFSVHGIHFLPVRQPRSGFLNNKAIGGYGLCMISGAKEFIPVLSVDFSALPSFFKSLHGILIHRSQHLPTILRAEHLISSQENSLVVYSCEHLFSDVPLEMESSKTDFEASEAPIVKRKESQNNVDLPMPMLRNPVQMNSSKLRKNQKRRSSIRSLRVRNLSSIESPIHSLCYDLNSSFVLSTSKTDFEVSPLHVKQVDSCHSDLIGSREESDNLSSPGSPSNLRKSTGKKSPEKLKDYRSSLVEVRQNIDSVSCNVNILVIESDRGWREDGARVMLEMSSSHEWFIAVKKGDVMRFLYKPQDWKPCVVNRFTHAYMWNSDDGWKLEFNDKWDWHVFKELHSECRTRNSQDAPVKLIPVPGIREVSGYEEDAVPSFVRPEMYIRAIDEVERALLSENSFYDMDLADEEWLRHLNSNSIGEEDGCCSISEENFESIVYTLEKNAYTDDAFDKEGALDLCQGLGRKEMVSAVYDYWLRKRKQKEEPVVRVFQLKQGQSMRRTLLFQKPFLRKKRSFKRQRSQAERNQADLHQVGRGKPYIFLQAEEDRQKHKAAEADAIRCIETATCLRRRAQMLMSNADLAAYKAAMALRIAETIRVSSLSEESRDVDSSFLFD